MDCLTHTLLMGVGNPAMPLAYEDFLGTLILRSFRALVRSDFCFLVQANLVPNAFSSLFFGGAL